MSAPPPAQNFRVSGHGPEGGIPNTSTTLGGNMRSGSEQRENTTSAQELGITLGNDGALKGTVADSKGGENLIPNPESKRPELSTAGPGGDQVRQPIHAHDVSLPPNALHLPPQTNESSRKPPYNSQSGQARE
ncbi:hypothetical protein A4X13_0g7102 [Tilletia indica]|uniref:Uncharacterized protein n=1 Tax=Tilletia indica TaxID=43049 RepID=A0A177TLE0_9BASI|nr:hypothetical protein A4X13_0g7102 [Tilletia indica]